MQTVSASPAGHDYLCSGRAAELGRKRGCLDFHLLHGVDRDQVGRGIRAAQRGRAAAETAATTAAAAEWSSSAGGRLIQTDAVERVVVRSGTQSVGVEAAGAVGGRHDTGRHKNQRFGVASICWQVLNIILFQRDAFGPFAGKSLGPGSYLHAGARGAYLQLHAKRLPVADLQRERVDLVFFEARLFRYERIVAGRQELEDGKAVV